MHRLPFVPIAAFGLALLTAGESLHGQQASAPAQDRPIEIFVDTVTDRPPATTLDERLAQADAVVRCRVLSSQVREITSPHPPNVPTTGTGALADVPDLSTESTVTVLEIYKSQPQLPQVGSILRVSQPLGTTTWRGRTVVRRDGRAKAFQPGEEYVLFLEWNRPIGLFTAVAADTFRVDGGSVEGPSEAQYGVAQRGVSAADFTARLRAAAAAARARK